MSSVAMVALRTCGPRVPWSGATGAPPLLGVGAARGMAASSSCGGAAAAGSSGLEAGLCMHMSTVDRVDALLHTGTL